MHETHVHTTGEFLAYGKRFDDGMTLCIWKRNCFLMLCTLSFVNLFMYAIFQTKLLKGVLIIYFWHFFLDLTWVIEEEMTRYHFKVKVRWRSKVTLMTVHHLHWGDLVLLIKKFKFNEAWKKGIKNSWKTQKFIPVHLPHHSSTFQIIFHFTLGKFFSYHFENILIKISQSRVYVDEIFSFQMQWRRMPFFTFHRFSELSFFSNRSSLVIFFLFIRKRREIWILMEIICIF